MNLQQVSSASTTYNGKYNHYILDVTAKLRTVTVPPKTFEDLGMKILKDIPEKYNSVYLACDTYRNDSIKENERQSRSLGKSSERLIIKSAKVRVPSNFQQFLNNGDNKERVFELIEEIVVKNASMLGNREIFFARKDKCMKITGEGIEDEFELRHEEADTKVTFFITYASSLNRRKDDDSITVRSYSGDIDIPVIMLGNNIAELPNVYLDNGTSKDRKIYSVSTTTLTERQKKAAIGVHCISGIDQNSSMLRKGKARCWKAAQRHLEGFVEMGESFDLSRELIDKMEKFVVDLYGYPKLDNVNEVRSKIFWSHLKKKKKIVSLSLLPPCQSSLELHIKRANYVATVWRQASNNVIIEDSPQSHGWNADFTLQWADAYPDYVYNMLRESVPVENDDKEDDEEEEEEFEDHDADVLGESD